jgi:hypothetical protein
MDYRTDTTAEDWRKKRDGLTTHRNALFKKYSKNADDLALALQIKKIDDEVAECTEKMSQERLTERRSK